MTRFFNLVENEKALSEVRRSHLARDLVLFVGAGVSASCGLPLWSELSSRVVASAFPPNEADKGWGGHFHLMARGYTSSKGSLEAMRIARKRLKKSFRSSVQEALYRNGFKMSETLLALSRLDRVRFVCSYNYDDLLEVAMRSVDACRSINSVQSGQVWKSELGSTTVFHPHGLLSSGKIQNAEAVAEIILSEDDYHRLYSEPYSWANLIQLKLLMSATALFVGCSLLDPNIRRLLDVVRGLGCHTHHYALMRDPAEAILDGDKLSGWDGLRVGRAIEIESDALGDLGIVPIWYNDHSDIPDLVEQILARDGLRKFGTRKGEREAISLVASLTKDGVPPAEIAQKLNSSNSYPVPRALSERPDKIWWDATDVLQLLVEQEADLRPENPR